MYYPINVNSYSDSQFINPKPKELKDYVKVNLSKHTPAEIKRFVRITELKSIFGSAPSYFFFLGLATSAAFYNNSRMNQHR